MNTWCKRIVALFIACIISAFPVFNSALADDRQNADEGPPIVLIDGIRETRGVWPPGSVWNIAQRGQYHYSGWAGSGGLYTDYKFTGKTWYHTLTHNTGQGAMKVTILKDYGYAWRYDTLASFVIQRGSSYSYTVSNLNTHDAVVMMFDTMDSYHTADFNGVIS